MTVMDIAERTLALDPTQSFIVEAPAGSGKTDILVKRFLHLLTTVQHPEEIIAITFTKKAAHEMRMRILHALPKHHPLLENPNRLSIQTIDAFCMRLTKQMPIVSQMGGDVRVAKMPDQIYLDSINQIIDTIDEVTPWQQALVDLFAHFDNQRDVVESVLLKMLSIRDQWLPHLVGSPQVEDLRKVMENELADINLRAMYAVDAVFPKDLVDIPSVDISALPSWHAFIDALLTKTHTYRKRVDKSLQPLLAALQENELVRQRLQALREAPPLSFEDDSYALLQSLLTLLPIIAAQLMVSFQQQGQVDFIEVATRALQALGDDDNPTDLALVLDHQIKHILVDEFQDTNITQFRLLEKLTMGWQVNDGRTLFVVGDPMQSIYRFREARVGLFLKAKQEGIGQIRLNSLKLCMNFRSEPLLIDWINRAMSEIMPDAPEIDLGAIPFNSSKATKTHEHGQLQAIIASHTDDEAKWICAQIIGLKKNHPDWSIAILLRAKSHASAILRELKAAQIPCQALEIEPLIKRPIVQDLLALTRALLNLDDRIAWLSLLRAPFCGLTLAEIESIAANKNARIWDAIALYCDNPRIMRFITALKPTLNAYDRMPFALWINSAALSLGVHHYANAQEKVDIQAFLNLIQSLSAEGLTLNAELIEDYLSNHYADHIEAHPNAVQMMTMHKSKGLEFDAVFLPSLGKRAAISDPPLMRYHDKLLAPTRSEIYHYLDRLDKQQQKFETQRLLYVALTRAKKQLYLSAVSEKETLTANSLGALLKDHLTTIAKVLPASDPIFYAKSILLKRLPLDWQLPSPWYEWLHDCKDEPLDDNTVDTTPFQIDNIMRRHVGTVLHRILKYMAENKLQTLSLKDSWRTQLITLGVPLSCIERALDLLQQAVNNVLQDPKGQWILKSHTESACEYPLQAWDKGEYKRIVIDRTFVDEAGIRWIIDYKSGEIDDEKHTAQLQQYARIMRHIDDRKICLAIYYPMIPAWRELT